MYTVLSGRQHIVGSSQPPTGCIFADFAFLFSNKNFMKIYVHIISVLTRSDIKFESKNGAQRHIWPLYVNGGDVKQE